MKHKNIYKKILVAFLTFSMIASGLFVNTSKVQATVNRQINYQGKLTNASNVAVTDGLYTMEFKLYTTYTGEAAIWTETLNTAATKVQVTNGLFSTMLGSTTALTGVDFNQTLYLGVNIESDGEMSPRKIIGAVPAALVADTVDNLSSEQFLRADASNSTSTASTFLSFVQLGAGKITEFFGQASASVLSLLSNGNVGIGTTTPYAKLSVAGNVVAQNFTATSSSASVLPYASTTALTVSGTNGFTLGSLTGPLQAVGGVVSASSSLSVIYGGTGITNPSAAGIMLGSYAGGTWQQLATSSLGLLTTNVSEGSNLYYLDSRVQSFVHASTTIPKTYTANSFTGLQQFNQSSTTLASVYNGLFVGSTATTTILGTATSTFGAGIQASYLNLTGSTASSTFAGGLIINGGNLKISTLTNCNGTSVLETDSSGNLQCGADATSAGSGISTVQEGGSTIEAAAAILNFTASDFNITSSPAGTANVAIDYSNSKITRTDQNQTITGLWQFGNASTTLLSVYNGLFVGGSATTTILGSATSTFGAGIQASYLNLTGSTATSTASNGFNLTAGCFSINNTCIGSGTVGSGTIGQIPYYAANGTTLSATSSIFVGLDGRIGIGATTTPWARLSIVGDTNNPDFVIATSSGVIPTFFVNSTTTGALDWARIAIGTSTLGAAGLRDQFIVSGRIYSTWREVSCDSVGASMTVALAADTANFCGPFALDVNTDGRVVLPTASPAFGRLEAGFTTSAALNEGVTLRTATIMAKGENPVYETKVKFPVVASSTMTLMGFYGSAMATATPATMPSDGAFFIATSSPNWIAMTRNANANSYTDTGIATSSSFQKLRIEMSNADVTYLINDSVVAKHTTNIPTVALSPTALIAVTSAGTLGNRQVDVQYIKSWVDDPPEAIGETQGASTTIATEQSATFSDLGPDDVISGGSISASYVANKKELNEEGTIVSYDTDHQFRVRASKGPYDTGIAGVISISNSTNYGQENQDTVRVADHGRVKVKVSLENGDIKIGDYITSSSEKGIGMKATRTGRVVGRALQSFSATSTEKTIVVSLEPSQYVENTSFFTFDEANQDGIKNLENGIDLVRALRPVSFKYRADGTQSLGFLPDEVRTISPSLVSLDSSGKALSVRYELLPVVLTQAIKNLDERVSRLEVMMASSSLAVTIDATSTIAVVLEGFKNLGTVITDGIASFKNIFAEKVVTKELCLDDLCITKDELRTLLNNANLQPHVSIPDPITQLDLTASSTTQTTEAITTVTTIPETATSSGTTLIPVPNSEPTESVPPPSTETTNVGDGIL